jgi:uncharacterized protein YprB with RNaseH-like and TPR domain
MARSFLDRDQRDQTLWLVGHNLLGFDIPFIQARALTLNLPPQMMRTLRYVFGGLATKPWHRKVIDTCDLWPRVGSEWKTRGQVTQDELCRRLGIERQEGAMGSDMADSYRDGRIADIVEHQRADIVQVREIYRRLEVLL